MASLNESDARKALAAAGAVAAAGGYEAHREVGGWMFSRRADATPARIGEYPWVVADDGRVAVVRVVESGSSALSRLARS